MNKIQYIVIFMALIFLVCGSYAFTNLDVNTLISNSDDGSSSNVSKAISNKIFEDNGNLSIENVVIYHNNGIAQQNSFYDIDNQFTGNDFPFHATNDPFTEDDLFKTFVDESGQEYIYIGNISAKEIYDYDIERRSIGTNPNPELHPPSEDELVVPLTPYEE